MQTDKKKNERKNHVWKSEKSRPPRVSTLEAQAELELKKDIDRRERVREKTVRVRLF